MARLELLEKRNKKSVEYRIGEMQEELDRLRLDWLNECDIADEKKKKKKKK